MKKNREWKKRGDRKEEQKQRNQKSIIRRKAKTEEETKRRARKNRTRKKRREEGGTEVKKKAFRWSPFIYFKEERHDRQPRGKKRKERLLKGVQTTLSSHLEGHGQPPP